MEQLIECPHDPHALPMEQPVWPLRHSTPSPKLEDDEAEGGLFGWCTVQRRMIRRSPLQIAARMPEIIYVYPGGLQPCWIRRATREVLVSLTTSMEHPPHEAEREIGPQSLQEHGPRYPDMAKARVCPSAKCVEGRRLPGQGRSVTQIDNQDTRRPNIPKGA
jgi:hypothetical protein